MSNEDHYHIRTFPARTPGAGVVYLVTYGDEAAETRAALEAVGCPDVMLVCVWGLDWGSDTTPWEAPSAFGRDEAYGGHADEFLGYLVERIVPRAEAGLAAAPAWRGLAGYSLGGLLAAYAPYVRSEFSRVASMSGSLWYPGFVEFATAHDMVRVPERAYLSLGDKESHTRNQVMASVGDRTQAFRDHLLGLGVATEFEFNPGGHFRDVSPSHRKGDTVPLPVASPILNGHVPPGGRWRRSL